MKIMTTIAAATFALLGASLAVSAAEGQSDWNHSRHRGPMRQAAQPHAAPAPAHRRTEGRDAYAVRDFAPQMRGQMRHRETFRAPVRFDRGYDRRSYRSEASYRAETRSWRHRHFRRHAAYSVPYLADVRYPEPAYYAPARPYAFQEQQAYVGTSYGYAPSYGYAASYGSSYGYAAGRGCACGPGGLVGAVFGGGW